MERARYYSDLINSYLLSWKDSLAGAPFIGLADAMDYSLNAGGKRLRPILTLEFSRLCGADLTEIVPIGCAVEFLHTYSLIHDDLPCMDNDDFRRGKPTNHKVFGETAAVLAGDALQAEAFKIILTSQIQADRKAKCAAILADSVGVSGMCGGQYMDTCLPTYHHSVEDLNSINSLKTGALISAACLIGVAAAGGDAAQYNAAKAFGDAFGRAFQIRDDVLDEIGTKEELGKDIGSDLCLNKITYMSLLGEDKCMEIVKDLTDTAKSAIQDVFQDTSFLNELADSMIWRCS